jgi:hypothetical protein
MCDFSAEHCVRPPWLLTNWGRLERYGRSSASETKGQRGTLQGPKTHSSHASPWSVESSLEGPGQHPWAAEEQVEPHVKKNWKKEDEHDSPFGTHDTNAQHELEYNECLIYD